MDSRGSFGDSEGEDWADTEEDRVSRKGNRGHRTFLGTRLWEQPRVGLFASKLLQKLCEGLQLRGVSVPEDGAGLHRHREVWWVEGRSDKAFLRQRATLLARTEQTVHGEMLSCWRGLCLAWASFFFDRNNTTNLAQVTFSCGVTHEIIAVSEPETCKYEMTLLSPMACRLVYFSLSLIHSLLLQLRTSSFFENGNRQSLSSLSRRVVNKLAVFSLSLFMKIRFKPKNDGGTTILFSTRKINQTKIQLSKF